CFQPGSTFNGTASLTVLAWDQTQGSAGNLFAVPSSLGKASAFSLASRTVKVQVNDAPAVGTPPALTTMNEDAATSSDQVSQLTTSSSDPNPGALKGIAVTAVTGNGTWQYSNGSSWLALGSVADNAARLLPASYRLRFRPAANWSGQATLTY